MSPKKTAKPAPKDRRPADVPSTGQVTPWPLLDRYPVVYGTGLTHAVIAAAFRSCTQGYRQQYVDILDELVEREPFGFACLLQRILTTAGARKVVRAARLPEDHPDKELAEKARKLVEDQILAIPNFTQHCATLLWAIYYGISALEISWERVNRPDASWWIKALYFIHSRRLAYPDQSAWRLHVWDQGAVSINVSYGTHPTEQLYGLAVDDYPFKFIVHVPQLRGDYPTRDGLGRELAYWFSLKNMAARGAGQTVERFAKPWAWATYNTATAETKLPREATKEDIDAADAAIKALGVGSLAGVTLPDSVTVNLKFPDIASAIGHKDFITLCDEQIAVCIRGNANTAKIGRTGARAALEVQNTDEQQQFRYDADVLGQTLTRDLATAVIALNMPEALHVVPSIEVAVDEEPDPLHVMEVAQKGALVGLPVDADKLGEIVKLPLIPNETKGPDGKPAPRRLVPIKPSDLSATDGSEPPEPPPPPPPAVPPPGAKPANDADEEPQAAE